MNSRGLHRIRILHSGQSRWLSLSQFAAMLKAMPKAKRSRKVRS